MATCVTDRVKLLEDALATVKDAMKDESEKHFRERKRLLTDREAIVRDLKIAKAEKKNLEKEHGGKCLRTCVY